MKRTGILIAAVLLGAGLAVPVSSLLLGGGSGERTIEMHSLIRVDVDPTDLESVSEWGDDTLVIRIKSIESTSAESVLTRYEAEVLESLSGSQYRQDVFVAQQGGEFEDSDGKYSVIQDSQTALSVGGTYVVVARYVDDYGYLRVGPGPLAVAAVDGADDKRVDEYRAAAAMHERGRAADVAMAASQPESLAPLPTAPSPLRSASAGDVQAMNGQCRAASTDLGDAAEALRTALVAGDGTASRSQDEVALVGTDLADQLRDARRVATDIGMDEVAEWAAVNTFHDSSLATLDSLAVGEMSAKDAAAALFADASAVIVLYSEIGASECVEIWEKVIGQP